MPPRIPALTAYCRAAPIFRSPVVSFLLPLMQTRNASILGALADNPGAYNKKIKRGRGPSSGKGKTSGRGQKGQKARGKAKPRFQGGQTPLAVIHGVKGFKNIFTEDLSTINLDKIQHWIDQGRLNPEQPITLKELAKSKCLRIKDGVKLLARGKEEFKSPINILVSRASVEAIKAIEDVGGKVTTRYYTKHSVRRILKGESDSGPSSFFPFGMAPPGEPDSAIQSASKPFMYRLPDPSSRKDIEYYRDAAHRGYLSHMVPAGHGPSLFFKSPGTSPRRMVKKKGAAVATGADNKIF